MFKPANIVLGVLILAWLIVSGFVAHDRISVLTSSQSFDASITHCKWKRTWVRRSMRRGTSHTYAPVTVSKQGYRVTGKLYIARKKNCERRIDERVKILVNPNNPDDGRINSFLQFWLYPMALTIAGGLLISAAFMASGVFTVIFLSGALIIGGGAYHEIKGFGAFSKNGEPIVVDNNAALEVCLVEARIKQGVTRNADITRLSCKRRSVYDLTPLSEFKKLEFLELTGNKIEVVSPLGGLTALKELTLDGNNHLRTLAGLEGLKSLEDLSVRVTDLDDITALSTLSSLKKLNISTNKITDISALEGLTNLVTVQLDENRNLSDISALANKPALNAVTLHLTQVNDLTPLYTSPKLRRVNLSKLSNVPCEQIKHIEKITAQTLKGVSGLKHCH